MRQSDSACAEASVVPASWPNLNPAIRKACEEFVATLPKEVDAPAKPLATIMKNAFKSLKRDLNQGDDGRLHGMDRQIGKIIDGNAALSKAYEKHSPVDSGQHYGDVAWKRNVTQTNLMNFFNRFSLASLRPHVERSALARRLFTGRAFAEEGQAELRCGNPVVAASLLTAAYRIECKVILWILDEGAWCVTEMNKIAECIPFTSRVRADALFVKANCQWSTSRELALESAELAVQLAPDDPACWLCLGDIQKMIPNQTGVMGAIASANRAIELDRSCALAYWLRGCMLQELLGDDFDCALHPDSDDRRAFRTSAWDSLLEYIRLADPEDRHVCQAYYHLAVLTRELGTARRFLDSGRAAEESKLFCFQGAPSNYRKFAEARLGSIRPCGHSDCPNAGHMKCDRCREASYCSRECQKSDWCKHKAHCKSVCGRACCSNTAVRKCEKCQSIMYCSVRCEADDRRDHKIQCKQWQRKSKLMSSDKCGGS